MATVDGTYDCVAKMLMGDEKGALTLVSAEGRFNGTYSGMTGLLDITDGTVSGNKLSWTMKATGSMPMILDCMAEVNGDAITGTMKLGFYGTSHFSGT